MNLIILTTAIIRGDFHKKSIGKFYELYSDTLKQFNVYHIINVDEPPKLKKKYSKKETINLFREIIPKSVKLTIIDNKNPGFLNAYKNVVKEVYKLNIDDIKNSMIWWFEDDWDISYMTKDLFNLIKLFPCDKSFAFNSVQNSGLGSFRAGPLMTFDYFKKYFDIESKGVMNPTCDPEKQVSRWLSGIDRTNGKQRIHRNIEGDNKVNIVYFYLENEQINVKEYPFWLYKNMIKYNQKIKFTYHAIKSIDLVNFEYGLVNPRNRTVTLKNKTFNEILESLDNGGINYITIKPYTFSDIGRTFNENNNLVKWTTINHNTTYV